MVTHPPSINVKFLMCERFATNKYLPIFQNNLKAHSLHGAVLVQSDRRLCDLQ